LFRLFQAPMVRRTASNRERPSKLLGRRFVHAGRRGRRRRSHRGRHRSVRRDGIGWARRCHDTKNHPDGEIQRNVDGDLDRRVLDRRSAAAGTSVMIRVCCCHEYLLSQRSGGEGLVARVKTIERLRQENFIGRPISFHLFQLPLGASLDPPHGDAIAVRFRVRPPRVQSFARREGLKGEQRR